MEREPIRRTLTGVVRSNRMDKSIVVEVARRVKHKEVGKYITRKSKLVAHDPQNACQPGDRVTIAECRPLSKTKRWRLLSIVEKARARAAGAADEVAT